MHRIVWIQSLFTDHTGNKTSFINTPSDCTQWSMYTVLYVDDEPGLLELGKMFLESTGQFKVEIISSVTEGFPLLTTKQFDVIISDYQMPVTDGIEFLRMVRASGNDIPFILFTGRGREEVVIAALNNGADYYLQKGGDPTAQFAELSHKIRLAVEQRHTLQALRESERKYRRILENMQDAYFRVNPEGMVTMVNPSAARMFGYDSVQEMIGIPATVLYVGGAKGREETIRKMREAGGLTDITHEAPRKDGSLFPISFNIQYIYDDAGRIIGTEAIARDITERKKAEQDLKRINEELNASYMQLAATEEELRLQLLEITEAQQKLRRSEEKFRSFTENIPDVTTITDEKGNFSYVSPSLLRLTGHNEEEIIGRKAMGEILLRNARPDDMKNIEALKSQARKHPGIPVFIPPFRSSHIDGSTIYIEGTATYLPDVEGIRGMVFHGRDVTDRVIASDALKESEQRFRAVIDQSPFAILVLTATGDAEHANDAYLRLWGVQRETMRKYNCFRDSQLDHLGLRPLCTRAFSGEYQPFPPVEFDLKTSVGEGGRKMVSGAFYPIRDEKGRVTNVIVVVQDLSGKSIAERIIG
ncbi:MAG: PAS domain S-box protein [Methanomicrobiales archaeon]|nr:PAS domain S-box protein [Methanomicrobiales archaeon]